MTNLYTNLMWNTFLMKCPNGTMNFLNNYSFYFKFYHFHFLSLPFLFFFFSSTKAPFSKCGFLQNKQTNNQVLPIVDFIQINALIITRNQFGFPDLALPHWPTNRLHPLPQPRFHHLQITTMFKYCVGVATRVVVATNQ